MIFVLPLWWFVVYTYRKGKSVARGWLRLCSQLQKKHGLAIVCLLQISCTCVKLVTCFFQLSVVFIFIPSLFDDARGFYSAYKIFIFFLQCCYEQTSQHGSCSSFLSGLLLFVILDSFGAVTTDTNFWTPILRIECGFRNAWNKIKLEDICNWSTK